MNDHPALSTKDTPLPSDCGLPLGSPEEAGFSSERLGRYTNAMRALIDGGVIPGVVSVIARHGKIVHKEVLGHRDIESKAPVRMDTIFRTYSMSKPVTGVAMMMLFEEGKWQLNDAVADHIPEFADLRVYGGLDSARNALTVDAEHPMTMRELMSHTGGLANQFDPYHPVDVMYANPEAPVSDRTQPLQVMIDRVSKLPLRHQPGSKYFYSISVDVQGYLVEKLSGQPFDEFLEERLFRPLKMYDSGFWVPPEKADRFATLYNFDDQGTLTSTEAVGGGDYLSKPVRPSGGGGMVSTVPDYVRFTQMMLNGGVLDGVRVLAPSTVELMHMKHFPDGADRGTLQPGATFGLDFSVYEEPEKALGVYAEGSYFWGGLAGTWFWIDPSNDLTVVGMSQNYGKPDRELRALSSAMTYQALIDPEI